MTWRRPRMRRTALRKRTCNMRRQRRVLAAIEFVDVQPTDEVLAVVANHAFDFRYLESLVSSGEEFQTLSLVTNVVRRTGEMPIGNQQIALPHRSEDLAQEAPFSLAITPHDVVQNRHGACQAQCHEASQGITSPTVAALIDSEGFDQFGCPNHR